MGKGIGSLISKSKKYYYTLKSVLSAQLATPIVFNRYGWKHLIYESSDRRRNNKDIELRLHLLRDAKTVLSTTKYPVITTTQTTLCGLPITYCEFYGKSKQTNCYYIKVIIRKIGNGNYHFFSIRRSKRNKNPA
jgi:hypothetical protein